MAINTKDERIRLRRNTMLNQLMALPFGPEDDAKNYVHRAVVSEQIYQSKLLGVDLVKVTRRLYTQGPIAVREAVYERFPIYPCVYSDIEGKVEETVIEILQFASSLTVCERVYKDELREKESWATSLSQYIDATKTDLIGMYTDQGNTFRKYKELYLNGRFVSNVIAKLESANMSAEKKEDEWSQFEQALSRLSGRYGN